MYNFIYGEHFLQRIVGTIFVGTFSAPCGKKEKLQKLEPAKI